MKTMTTQDDRMMMIFNEWARRYDADPSEFEGHQVDGASYGYGCMAYFRKLESEMDAENKLPKKQHAIMTIQPMRDCWKYSIIKGGECFHGIIQIITLIELLGWIESVDEVFIDEGFRTIEARAAAKKYGWTLTRFI